MTAFPAATLHVGFTGTRYGMTTLQHVRVVETLQKIVGVTVVAHHGDCVGADDQFHELVRRYLPAATIEIHPGPLADIARQAGKVGDVRHAPLPHMARNREIVLASSAMIATPFEYNPQTHGGTWGTIRIARKNARPLALIRPDGVLVEKWATIEAYR